MPIFIAVVKMHQSQSMTFKNRPFPLRPSNRHVELAALGADRVEVLAREELVTHEVAHLCRGRVTLQLHAEPRDRGVARRAPPVLLARCEEASL